MKKIALLFAFVLFPVIAWAQNAPAGRDKTALPATAGAKPDDSTARIQALELLVRSLADEVAALHGELRELRKTGVTTPASNGLASSATCYTQLDAFPVECSGRI